MLRRRFGHLSIRNKLLALVLLPLLVVLPLLGAVLLWWIDTAFDRLLVTKVRSDLAVARGYFEQVLAQVGAGTGTIAKSHELHRVLEGDRQGLVSLLQRTRDEEGLDFINLRDADGSLLATDAGLADGSAADGPELEADAGATSRTHVEVLSAAQLARVAPHLAPRIDLPLLATRNAAPTRRAVEDRAMVLLAARPVLDREGRVIARVQGGVLLNRNLALIDHINDIVYPQGSLPFGSQGTATLFLDDVRISTNVRLFGGAASERAIGTRVSASVRDTVLGRGITWLDRAFVVDDWYVSAYQPLVDGQGRRVGMLYVGFLERPFRWVKYGALASIGAVFLAVMIVAALVSLRSMRTLFAPIERMATTMKAVGDGALDARAGPTGSDDEIGQLARQLDELLATMQRWNGELDAKVTERTQQLADAQARLVRSEKMATIGQLTAGIAHEVNNPIAVMQGNLDVIRQRLPRAASAGVTRELNLIDEQIERMRLIVTQLLQFAKPGEYAGYIQSVDPAQVVEDSLVLVERQIAASHVDLRLELQPTPRVAINRQELQQVLVNLIVNATLAMPTGGTLTLRTSVHGDRVRMAVEDTGEGLSPDLLRELFQPFVTRRKDGTGLGLWISRGIVERYGGDILAANRDDGQRGACFTVILVPEGVRVVDRRDASA
jgi:signal transduction histidine kinase